MSAVVHCGFTAVFHFVIGRKSYARVLGTTCFRCLQHGKFQKTYNNNYRNHHLEANAFGPSGSKGAWGATGAPLVITFDITSRNASMHSPANGSLVVPRCQRRRYILVLMQALKYTQFVCNQNPTSSLEQRFWRFMLFHATIC